MKGISSRVDALDSEDGSSQAITQALKNPPKIVAKTSTTMLTSSRFLTGKEVRGEPYLMI